MNVEHYLKQHITQHGPITVAEFMQLALMHPQYGYYQKQQPFGAEGDFTTAPEISQIFGEMVGVWVASIWQQLGSPSEWALVELGPGRGTLMHDILRSTKHVPQMHAGLTIILIEQSEALKAKQAEKLAQWPCHVEWQPAVNTLPAMPTIIVANEFFDALPIQQYVKQPEGFFEKLVGLKDGKLTFQLGAMPINPPLSQQVLAGLTEGEVIEASPISTFYMQQLSEHIKQVGGAAMMIDYGYEAPASGDSLQAVKQHQYHPILEDVGEADITAHVNFTALAQAAQKAGCAQSAIQTQAAFLKQMGIETRAEILQHNADPKQHAQIQTALHRLMADDEMGSLFKVLMVA